MNEIKFDVVPLPDNQFLIVLSGCDRTELPPGYVDGQAWRTAKRLGARGIMTFPQRVQIGSAPTPLVEHFVDAAGVHAPPPDTPVDLLAFGPGTGMARELAAAVNRVGADNVTDTPDFVLGDLLAGVLVACGRALRGQRRFFGEPERRTFAQMPGAPAERSAEPPGGASAGDPDPETVSGDLSGLMVCPHGYSLGERCPSGFCGDGSGTGVVVEGDLIGPALEA